MRPHEPSGPQAPPLREERVAEVLRERAARLAARRTHLQEVEVTVPTLVVLAGEERLGLRATAVQELGRLSAVTPVPGAHPHLLGVISLHNEFVSLLNPLGLTGDSGAPVPEQAFTHAVLLRHDRLRLALACHEVLGIQQVPATAWGRERTHRSGDDIILLLSESEIFSQYES